jgi:hypothetical protein
MSFDNNIFASPENESPFNINQFLNPLMFIRVVKVLELMTFSNRGHFDHCTLCWDGPTMKYMARHHNSFSNFDSPSCPAFNIHYCARCGILDVIHEILVLVPIRSRAGTAQSKGLLDSGTEIQINFWTRHLHNILWFFLMKLKNCCANVSIALCTISFVLHFLYKWLSSTNPSFYDAIEEIARV